MKKIILTTFIFSLLLSSNVFSQDKKYFFGIKGGLNIATMNNLGSSNSASFGGTKESSSHPAYLLPHLGVYAELKFNEFVSFQPELLYSAKGYKLKYEYRANKGQETITETTHRKLTYIDLPLLLRFNTGRGFHIIGGPSLGILIKASLKAEREEKYYDNISTIKINDNSKTNLNSIDVGMYLGLGYQLKNGLNFGIRWNRGFSDVFTDGNNHQNSVVQISTGFAF